MDHIAWRTAALLCPVAAVLVLAGRWWIELPLVALLVGAATRRAQQPRRAGEGMEAEISAGAIDQVVLAVNRGGHVEEVLSSLARQACSIMRVERAIVML